MLTRLPCFDMMQHCSIQIAIVEYLNKETVVHWEYVTHGYKAKLQEIRLHN